jgi:hypothetical protein
MVCAKGVLQCVNHLVLKMGPLVTNSSSADPDGREPVDQMRVRSLGVGRITRQQPHKLGRIVLDNEDARRPRVALVHV